MENPEEKISTLKRSVLVCGAWAAYFIAFFAPGPLGFDALKSPFLLLLIIMFPSGVPRLFFGPDPPSALGVFAYFLSWLAFLVSTGGAFLTDRKSRYWGYYITLCVL